MRINDVVFVSCHFYFLDAEDIKAALLGAFTFIKEDCLSAIPRRVMVFKKDFFEHGLFFTKANRLAITVSIYDKNFIHH